MTVATYEAEALAPETETRLARFSDLVATAIANAQARAEVERLAHEQAALRRVATLVAQRTPSDALLAAVCDEVRAVVGAEVSVVVRFEADGTLTLRATNADRHAVGARLELDPDFVVAAVRRTGRAARLNTDDPAASGASEVVRDEGVRSAVASPIVVERELWGAIVAGSRERRLAAGMERRLADFTELVATAISNVQARAEVERLAAEQAALRRVATLVAEGAEPATVFDAVAAEMARLLGADPGFARPLRGPRRDHRRRGSRVGPVAAATGIAAPPARAERDDNGAPDRAPCPERRLHVGGWPDRGDRPRQWPTGGRGTGRRRRGAVGAITANWASTESPPGDTGERMARFAELLDSAIANADSRDQLTASRARLVAAGDDARRRLVRDLHDGAQQRLVHTIVALKLAQRALRQDDGRAELLIADALGHAAKSNEELRELAHGILPAVLTRGGLPAAVRASRPACRCRWSSRSQASASRPTSRPARTSRSPRPSRTS